MRANYLPINTSDDASASARSLRIVTSGLAFTLVLYRRIALHCDTYIIRSTYRYISRDGWKNYARRADCENRDAMAPCHGSSDSKSAEFVVNFHFRCLCAGPELALLRYPHVQPTTLLFKVNLRASVR